jgi:RNA polymerase sigma-70 factor, ECF subfamily
VSSLVASHDVFRAVDDADLMLRVRAGDEGSFALLLARYRIPVIRYLYRVTQNQALAEELAQDVFLRVYRARVNYQVKAKFSTWLFRIATHVALNWRRDVRKERGLEPLEGNEPEKQIRQLRDAKPNVEQTLLRRVKADYVRRAIRALPEKQRAAVVLHKYHELDYVQMAGALGCSPSAVKSMLFRAYEKLRISLAMLNECKEDFTPILQDEERD